MTWTSRYSEKWPRLTALFHLDNGVDMEHNENGRYETQFQEPPAEPFYKFYLHPDDIGRGRSVSQYSMQDVGRSGTYRGGPKTSLCRMFLGTLLLFSLAGIVAVAVTLAVLLSQPHHRPYTTTKVDNETRFTEEYLAQKERILSKELCGLMKSMFKLESNRNDPVKKCSVALMIKDGHMKVNFLVPTSDDFIKEEIDKIKENVLKNILDMDAGLGVVSNAEDVNVSRKQIAKTTPRISTVEIIVTTMKPSISVTMTTPIRDINMKFTTVKFNIENSTLRTPEITTQNVNKSGTHETVTSQSTVTAKSFTKLDLVTPTLTSAGIQRNETMISLKTKNVTNDNFNETSEAGPTSVMPEITSSESTTTTQAEDTTPTIFTHTDLAKLFPLLSKKIDLSGLFLEPDYYTTSQNKKGGKSEMTTMSALSEFVPDWTNGGQKFGHPLVTTTEQTTKSYDENIMKNVDLFTTKKDDHSSHTHDHGDFGFGSNDTFDFGGLFLPSDKHSQESPLSFPDSHPTTSEYTDIDHFGHYDLSNFSFVSGIPDNITDELSTLDNVSPDKITTEANTATPFFNYDFGLDFSGMWSPDDPENTTTLPVTTTANNFKEGTQIEHKTDTFNTEHLETIRNVTDFPQLQNYTNAVTLKSTESMHFTEMTTGTPNAHLSLHNDTETGKEMNFNDFTFVSSIPVENQETTTTSMFAKSDFGMPFVDHEQSSNKSKHLMIDNDVMLESKDMMPTEINSSFAPNSRTIHIYPSVTTEASYYKSSRKEIIQVFSTDIRYASAYYALDSLTDSYQIQKAPQKSSISNLQGTWDDLKPIVYSTPYLPLEVSQPPMHTSPISTLKTEERNSMFSSISFSYQTESPGLEEESLKSEERLTSSASKLYQIDSPDFGKSNLKIQTRDISQSLVRISPISTLKTGEQFTSSTSVSYQTDSPVFDEKLESSFTGNMPKALKQPNSSFPSIAIRVSNHPKVLISSEDINILPTSSSVLYRPRESINQKPYSSQIYMSEFGLGDINGFFPDMSFPDHIMIDHSLLNGPEVSGKVRVSSAILPAFSSKSSEHSLLSNLQSQKPITTTSVPYNNLSFSGRISMQTRIRDMNKNPSATEIISQNFKNNDTIRDTEDFLLSNQFTFPNISDDYPSNIRFTNSSFEENLSATSAKASTSLSSSLFNVPSSSTVSENLKSSYISLGNENMSSVAIPKQISSSTHMNEWSSISSPLLSGSVKDFDSSNFNDLQLSIAFVSSTDASSAHLVTSPILSRTTDSPSVKGLHLQESVRLTPTKTVLSFENLKITFSTPSPQGFSSKTKNKSDNVFLDKSKQSRYIDTMLTSSEIQQSEGSSDKSSTVAISSDNSDSYLSPSLHTSIEFQKESTLATPFIKYTSVILPRMSKVENTASIHVPLTNNMTSLRASVLQSTINNTLIDMQSYKPSPSAIYSSTGTRQVIQNDTKVHQQKIF